MLQILGYLLLFGIVCAIIKFGILLILRCCTYGILAFCCVGCVTFVLFILGVIESGTAWAISKWAFFIGLGCNVIELFVHPSRIFSDVKRAYKDDSGGGTITSSSSESDDNGNYPGYRCCDNCWWNQDKGSHYSRCAQDGRDDRTANDYCSYWRQC